MRISIGTTEQGDPGFDLSWESKLFTANVIITKQLRLTNASFIEALLRSKDKIILHVGCTGFGGTAVEPNVPTPEEIKEAVLHLQQNGFPPHQMVLRIDPIIPTEKGLKRLKHVLETFRGCGIKRVRISVLDLYPHVRIRFANAGLPLPFDGFNATWKQFRDTENTLREFESVYSFEACAEPNLQFGEKIGCISQRDLEALNIAFTENDFSGSGFQRNICLCPSGKTELLSSGRKQCPSGCLYCYWKG